MHPDNTAHSDGVPDEENGRADLDPASSGPYLARPLSQALEDLRDLPQRLLPEETVRHLKNAGKEALLALYSLWKGIDAARQGKPVNKVRKHIDIE